MKVCIEAHHLAAFGDIPAGSLWADDSPFVVEADKFADVLDDRPTPVVPVVRKFAAKSKGDQ